MAKDIIGFYKGAATNQVNNTIDEVLTMNDRQLEEGHYYIQWLFPLPEASNAVPDSPIMCQADIDEFNNDEELQRKMVEATLKMMKFYGLTLDYKGRIVKASNWDEQSQNWLTSRNHNFLRLSRIIRSLKLCGLERWARAVHSCLCEIYEEHKGVIGPLTKQFWDEAIEKNE